MKEQSPAPKTTASQESEDQPEELSDELLYFKMVTADRGPSKRQIKPFDFCRVAAVDSVSDVDEDYEQSPYSSPSSEESSEDDER